MLRPPLAAGFLRRRQAALLSAADFSSCRGARHTVLPLICSNRRFDGLSFSVAGMFFHIVHIHQRIIS